MQEIYEIVDSWIEQVYRKFEIGCKERCIHCCHILNTVHFAESVFILKHVKAKNIYDENKANVLDEVSMFRSKSDSVKEKNYVKLGRKCIFLNRKNLCSIYSIRPVSCRTHLANKKCDFESTTGNYFVDPKVIRKMVMAKFLFDDLNGGLLFRPAPFAVSLFMADIYLKSGFNGLVEEFGTPITDLGRWVEAWIWTETK